MKIRVDRDDPRLKKVKFVVFDADPFEVWRQWHNRLVFKQDSLGFTFQYAKFGKTKPCWASLFFYEIEGVFTAFVDAHGAYFDHFALEQTVWELVGMKPTPDNHTDGTNFHNHIAWHKMDENLRRERLIKCAEYRLNEAANDLSRYKNNL